MRNAASFGKPLRAAFRLEDKGLRPFSSKLYFAKPALRVKKTG